MKVSDEELMGIVSISFEEPDEKEDCDEDKGDSEKNEDKIIYEEKAANFSQKNEKEI